MLGVEKDMIDKGKMKDVMMKMEKEIEGVVKVIGRIGEK